ncbi:MAG TPA: hypothetical protein VGK09_05290 [Rhodocyclaceae bacterium]|jgi:hypothetical protein
MCANPEAQLQELMPSSIIIGIEALRREAWTTQIPYLLDVAIESKVAPFHDDQFVIKLRSSAWFDAVTPYLKGDRAFGIPWLSPAWALADMLNENGWGSCGLWPDDIEWDEIAPTDEAEWRIAANFFRLPNHELLSIREESR